MTPFAVEKDWWVSQTLKIIFQMPIAKHLVFKGGTSLSNAWRLIHRFSEDIDLAVDKNYFVSSKGTWSRRAITNLRKEAGIYSTGIFFEELKSRFLKSGFKGLEFKVVDAKDSDQDPRIIEIYYPNEIFGLSEYLLPRVQLEIGCRSLRDPFSDRIFGSLVDEVYAGKEFAEELFSVPTVNPERTFLEKIFLLHEEFHRPSEKMRVNRLSRHLYDVHHLVKAGIVKKAIMNKGLYETIVDHRYRFSRLGGVDYNLHNPMVINPIPPPEIIGAWKSDYAQMLEDMIYEESKPTFEQLIDSLNELKIALQKLKWKFELSFPNPD